MYTILQQQLISDIAIKFQLKDSKYRRTFQTDLDWLELAVVVPFQV